MVTIEQQSRLHLRKDNGLVKDVFHKHHMLELKGNVGIGHCRYPTAGSSSCAEAQPLYTNCPFGICVAHNGNLVNTEELLSKMRDSVGRHINTDSDSELLLNVFAEYLTKETRGVKDFNIADAILTASKLQPWKGSDRCFLVEMACGVPSSQLPLSFALSVEQ